MPAYTALLQKPLEEILWEDNNFIEELLQVVQLFRPFSAAITELLAVGKNAGMRQKTCKEITEEIREKTEVLEKTVSAS